MGIPGLFSYLKKNCAEAITNAHNVKKPVETLAIDMNGLYHEACQKVYNYGNYKKFESVLHKEQVVSETTMRNRAFREVGKIMDNLVFIVKPTKRVLLMVDGIAGVSKQNQQRQRRYRSAHDKDKKFDTNCISPGTIWMDYLSKYIDQFLRQKITYDSKWMNLEVVFSNDKVAGEGEQKILKYAREHPDNSYTIYGLDADIIMLALLTQNFLTKNGKSPEFYILRDDPYMGLINFDIYSLREYILTQLIWSLEDTCDNNSIISDFVFLCFLLGNDFVPHSPSIDLVNGGVEMLFSCYKQACINNDSHLLKNINSREQCFNTNVLSDILYNISVHEQTMLKTNMFGKIVDPMFNKYVKEDTFDYDGYTAEYYKTKFTVSEEQVCLDYIRGMEWIMRYYNDEIPSWDWFYPHSYAPFANELYTNLRKYEFIPFKKGKPYTPFHQLLSVMPPQSKALLPTELHFIIEKFPTEITIDLAGKKFDWQGIVLIPRCKEYDDLGKIYSPELIKDETDRRRNNFGSVFSYKYSNELQYNHKTYYGEFISKTGVKKM